MRKRKHWRNVGKSRKMGKHFHRNSHWLHLTHIAKKNICSELQETGGNKLQIQVLHKTFFQFAGTFDRMLFQAIPL